MNRKEIVEDFMNGYFKGTIKIHQQLNEPQSYWVTKWQELKESNENSNEFERATDEVFGVVSFLRSGGTKMIENVFNTDHEKRINAIENELKKLRKDIDTLAIEFAQLKQSITTTNKIEEDLNISE
jgi:hypothetical protein